MPVRFSNPAYQRALAPNEDAPPHQCFVAFAGRSNSGKSSVINALCNGRYARVSSVPGSTQAIQLFDLPDFAIADFPGYGYAARAKRQRYDWQIRTERFLNTARLVCIVTVVDCRRGIGDADDEWLLAAQTVAAPKLILLNKIDKFNQREQHAAVTATQARIAAEIVPFSATKKTGVASVRHFIARCLSASL